MLFAASQAKAYRVIYSQFRASIGTNPTDCMVAVYIIHLKLDLSQKMKGCEMNLQLECRIVARALMSGFQHVGRYNQ